jgi:hypothetical protein
MNYTHECWPIRKLVELYEGKKLDLTPPYQRNPIWSSATQKALIAIVLRGWPMPNFFLLERADEVFEVVDGKQRARISLAFWGGHLEALDGRTIDSPSSIRGAQTIRDTFLSYLLSVTIVRNPAPDESIEKFCALVNSTGLRLNRPEICKADSCATGGMKMRA